MASLGVLASLMQNLSPQVGVPQWNPVEEAQQQERLKGRRTDNETALLTLFDLKQRQASEQEVLAAIQKDPRIAQMLLGGSTIGSLGTAPPPGAPGAAPMTQQTLMPGQPPGAPQTVPGGQDLSQFATQGGPDQRPRGFAPDGAQPQQSILASLGPVGQPQMQAQAPQNPLLAMAAQNPRAALMMRDQIEGRQDAAMKRQGQQLEMGAKVLGYVAQQAQGVTDQASLDALRSDLQSQGLGKYAAQLPQLYSKGAMEPFIAKALDVEKSLTLQIADMDSQRKALAAHQKNLLDQQQHGEKMTLEREKIGQQQTQQQQTQQTQTRSAEFNLQGEYNKLALPYREVRDAMGRIEAAGTSPTAAGDAALITAYMKMLDPTTGVRDAEVRNAQSVGGLPQQAAGWLEWLRGGAPLKDDVRKDFMERAQKLYAQYQKDYEQVGTQYREQAERQGLDPRNVVQDYRSTTPAGGRTGKPVAQMSADETRAEIAAIKARGGR